ncbi:dihydrofolate reductase family protein [Nonomuraea sp. NPDC049419]|uniref:dihydrofolate reductase family protein n=1 Tax=Nonomuraea sp. NPDC049419 TaxID=3155772 RepID=UPI0034240207
MSRIVLDVSISLDGFSAGPGVRMDEPMGDGGERLHEWMAAEPAIRQEVDASVGAALIGRRTFELGLRPWGGTPWPYAPGFVVTHRIEEDFTGDNGGRFSFDGLEAAARRAKEAADGKDVLVLGADLARSLLVAGLLDEVHLHVMPFLLGEGTPLFGGVRAELEPLGAPVGGVAAHMRYRVR